MSWNLSASGHRAHWDGGVREAFGHGDDVGCDPETLGGEGRAQTAKAGDHLVEDEEDAVGVADRPQTFEIALGWDQHPGGPGHRLDDHRGDGRGVVQTDDVLQGVSELGALLGLAAAKAVANRIVGVR